jgi:hypothetical protein
MAEGHTALLRAIQVVAEWRRTNDFALSRIAQRRHVDPGVRAIREDLGEFRARPCLPIHDRDQLVPGIRGKLEMGAIGEQA